MLFVATEDWAFITHRVPMARAAQDMGLAVHVACRIGAHREEIEALGIEVHPLRLMQRGGINPTRDIRLVVELAKLIREVRPAVCNLVAIKPVVLGLAACVLNRSPAVICTFIGMGSIYRGANASPMVRRAITGVIRVGASVADALAVVQNPDDADFVHREFSIPKDRIRLVEGSGIDTGDISYRALPARPDPVRFVFAGRLLRDKGVYELLEAFKQVQASNPRVELVLIGDTDPANPSSLTPEDVDAARRCSGVQVVGHLTQAAVIEFMGTCDVAVLPSYGEGLPRFLLEAGASGLALIAADVPGCRSVVVDEVTGILVPAERVEELAEAMSRMATDHEFRRTTGRNARNRVAERFDSKVIRSAISAVYATSLSEAASRHGRMAANPGGHISSGRRTPTLRRVVSALLALYREAKSTEK